MVNVILDLWTWKMPKPANKPHGLVVERLSANAGKYKLWLSMNLNGSYRDWKEYEYMDLFAVAYGLQKK